MTRMKLKTFHVEGVGMFPYDMLRYDACWPATQDDSLKLEGTIRGRRTVLLETFSSQDVTAERWQSFGWKVLA